MNLSDKAALMWARHALDLQLPGYPANEPCSVLVRHTRHLHMAFDTLSAILYDEDLLTQLHVTFYVIFAIASLHLMSYTFRIVLMLSVLEQPKPANTIRSTSTPDADDISMLDLGTNDRDSDLLPTAQQRLFRRYKRRSLAQNLSELVWRLILSPMPLVRHPPADADETVTRSLAATIQHLRYYSGSSFFFTRGLVLYLLWYHGGLAVFDLVCSIILLIPRGIIFLFQLMFKQKPKESDSHDSSETDLLGILITEIFLGVLRGTYFALVSEQLAFHTIRVLSVSTQLTTNTATKYFNPKTFAPHRRHARKQLPRSFHVFWGFLYGLATSISNAVPYQIVSGFTSVEAMGTVSNLPPVFLKALIWRFFLTVCLDVPITLMFVSSQATNIDPNEHTIVHYRLGPQTAPYSDVLTRINWDRWIRVLRNMIQCLIVGSMTIATVLLLAYLQFQDLRHADKLQLWIFGRYLAPDRSHGQFMAFRTLNWWRNNVLITLNPWKFVFPYSEGFIRSQVFGGER